MDAGNFKLVTSILIAVVIAVVVMAVPTMGAEKAPISECGQVIVQVKESLLTELTEKNDQQASILENLIVSNSGCEDKSEEIIFLLTGGQSEISLADLIEE